MLLLFLGKLQYLKITQPFTAIPENVSYIILEGTTGSLCWLTQDLRHISILTSSADICNLDNVYNMKFIFPMYFAQL